MREYRFKNIRRTSWKRKKEDMRRQKKIARDKIDFLKHFMTFSIVMAILATINNLTDPGGYQWWLWPATCWGIGVFINFLSVFTFKGRTFKRYEQQLVQRELEKMNGEVNNALHY
jgi:hypothetical protein